MFFLWLFFCLLSACLLEVLLGIHNIALPILLATIFYFSCLVPWQKSILLFFLAAGLLDSCFARFFPSTGLSLLAILVFASRWKRYGDMNSMFALLFPGAVIGMISAAFLFFNALLSGGHIRGSALVFFSGYCMASAFLLPLLWWLLEKGARLLALRRQEIFSPAIRMEEYSAREEAIDE